jgi:hypothetical protein
MVVFKGKWTSETLKEAMDVVEKRTCYLQKANKSWNMPMNSFVAI